MADKLEENTDKLEENTDELVEFLLKARYPAVEGVIMPQAVQGVPQPA